MCAYFNDGFIKISGERMRACLLAEQIYTSAVLRKDGPHLTLTEGEHPRSPVPISPWRPLSVPTRGETGLDGFGRLWATLGGALGP